MPVGRPTIYTPELGAEICKRIAEGESLRAICNGPVGYDPLVDEDKHSHMPDMSTVLDWALNVDHEFSLQYERARRNQMEFYADKITEWPDEYAEVARARLKSDNVKWLMARMASSRYGDRIAAEITGKDGESFGAGATTQLASLIAAAAAKASTAKPDDDDDIA